MLPEKPMTIKGFATRAIHSGATGGLLGDGRLPITQTNGFAFRDIAHGADIFAGRVDGFNYARGAHPNAELLELRVADLEGGKGAVAFGSGLAAFLAAVCVMCRSGDALVASRAVFGGSLATVKRLQERFGIIVRTAENNSDGIAAALCRKTRCIFVESIVNPSGEITDIPAIAAIAKARRIPLLVDNTAASPALFRPIEHGADVVMHSASKYMAGHGHAIAGVLIDAGTFDWSDRDHLDFGLKAAREAGREPEAPFAEAARHLGLREFGGSIAATTAFLVATGIETMALRMPKHVANAKAVARALAGHKAIRHVSHPSIEPGADHNRAAHLMPDGPGAIFTATLKDGLAAAEKFVAGLKTVSHLVNVGETRTLVCHPATTTHRALTEAERVSLGIHPGTLRFSIGIEDERDLIRDMESALG